MFAPQTRAAYLLLIPSTGCYFGTPVTLHQKQPLTKIAVLYLRITISGLPGTLLTFSLYRYPCAHSHFRTVISGFVALLRICDMQRWRWAGVSFSVSTLVVIYIQFIIQVLLLFRQMFHNFSRRLHLFYNNQPTSSISVLHHGNRIKICKPSPYQLHILD